jgi:hypothetical protein
MMHGPINISPKRLCGLVRPEDEGKTILRYLGDSLGYLLEDINTPNRKYT